MKKNKKKCDDITIKIMIILHIIVFIAEVPYLFKHFSQDINKIIQKPQIFWLTMIIESIENFQKRIYIEIQLIQLTGLKWVIFHLCALC